MNTEEQQGFLRMLAEDFRDAPDNALLGARRTLNSELRERGYCTDQDSAAGGIVVGGAYVIGYICGLSSAVLWAVS